MKNEVQKLKKLVNRNQTLRHSTIINGNNKLSLENYAEAPINYGNKFDKNPNKIKNKMLN